MRIIWIRSPVTYVTVVQSTWPSWAMWQTHAPTCNKWHEKKKKKKTLHMLAHGAMWGCGLASWVVCNNDKFCDIRERNVTIRSEIWTTNIYSLGFWDIRECVTLWGLTLRSLGCIPLCNMQLVWDNWHIQIMDVATFLITYGACMNIAFVKAPWCSTKPLTTIDNIWFRL